ncbi:hypothetical protein OHB05_37310 [Streptomyces sp. NBC_00638]|uniref:hypothetical protein n=1 Tax=Streptomyces sp. NBC_00638 TaxID=2975794 RepID=UPI00225903D0|nr:hypothetical protein [Streptomyces sp. NBC_00638]MCX5008234.1 hypothetical protein [Streptomyces sp. NBC_00638]
MDHFERELSRMMRDAQEHTPFEPAQQDSLRAGVRVRRRVRAAQMAASCVLAVAGVSLGLFLLPHAPDRDRPLAPVPRPATSPTSPYGTPTPTHFPSGTPTGSATAESTDGISGPPNTPTTTGSSSSVATDPAGTATTGAPATAPVTPGRTPSSPPTTTLEPSSFASETGAA